MIKQVASGTHAAALGFLFAIDGEARPVHGFQILVGGVCHRVLAELLLTTLGDDGENCLVGCAIRPKQLTDAIA
jgi:hypothetical protein